jgi:heat shock protein HtpX
MNNLKTVALLGFMSALVALIAMQFSDSFVVPMLFVVGLNVVAYFFSDKMAIAATRAKPVADHELPQVYSIVSNLTARTGMPMPRIYLIDARVAAAGLICRCCAIRTSSTACSR